MTKTILTVSVTLAIGLSLGACLNRVLSNDDPTVVPIARSLPALEAARPAAVAVASGNSDSEQVRAVIREELAAALAKQDGHGRSWTAGSQSAPQATQTTKLTPEQSREVMQEANAIITNGQWGIVERARFHEKLAMLDPVQAEQEMQQLVKAIDNGSVPLVDGHPIL
jgi:hypothetical protein